MNGKTKAKMEKAQRGEMERVKFYWLGHELSNGAKVLDVKPSSTTGWVIVLAEWRGEFVTWNMYEISQELQSGHYFPDPLNGEVESKKDFNKRS